MKIVALGDSITQGFPYSFRESWVYLAARELNLEIINQGICGDLTRDMLRRFRQDVLAHNPTHVIVLGGTNDAFLGYPVTEVSANFTAMVDLAWRNEITPVLGLPVPSLTEEEQLLLDYRTWIRELARRKGIDTIDFYTPFKDVLEAGMGKGLYADEVHPSLEGYRLMGEVAVKSLTKYSSERG